jgi:hypothetical protein
MMTQIHPERLWETSGYLSLYTICSGHILFPRNQRHFASSFVAIIRHHHNSLWMRWLHVNAIGTYLNSDHLNHPRSTGNALRIICTLTRRKVRVLQRSSANSKTVLSQAMPFRTFSWTSRRNLAHSISWRQSSINRKDHGSWWHWVHVWGIYWVQDNWGNVQWGSHLSHWKMWLRQICIKEPVASLGKSALAISNANYYTLVLTSESYIMIRANCVCVTKPYTMNHRMIEITLKACESGGTWVEFFKRMWQKDSLFISQHNSPLHP